LFLIKKFVVRNGWEGEDMIEVGGQWMCILGLESGEEARTQ
jgi:hypothetical protein